MRDEGVLQVGDDCLGDLVVLSRLERDTAGVHGKHVAELKRIILVLRDDVDMQVMHSVAVGAKVDLVGVERLVQRGGNVADVGHKGSRVFLGHARNVVDMLLGGNDHTALVALLLKQDELAGGQVEHGDAKSIDERIIGPAHAIRAIGVLFHDGPFDLDKNECRYF